jgi:gas vesicle protein|nr:YtxH domain-containing protein [uncultured Phocaeicola sp.]
MNKIMSNGKFFVGLALGALVGSALSCFAHSNRGRKLRRDLYDTIQDLEEDAYDFAHRAKHKAERVGGEVMEKMNQQAEVVKGKLNEVTNK